jgi:hypothetical protein
MVVSDNVSLIERIRQQVRDLPPMPRLHLLGRMFAGFLVDIATTPPVFAAVTHRLVCSNLGMVNRRLDPEYGASRRKELPRIMLTQMRASQAALGLSQLGRIDEDARCRIKRAMIYHDGFGALSSVGTPCRREDLSNIYTYFPIRVQNREELLRYAQQRGRDFAAQHLRNCADLPAFSEYRADCRNARQAAKELVLLPTYPGYPESEVRKNIEVVSDFLSRRFN